MPSFDVVSELELFEVNHAVQNTQKEIATRFDFRGSDVSIELNEKAKEIKITGENELQVENVYAMLENHFHKRRIDIQALDAQKASASGKRTDVGNAKRFMPDRYFRDCGGRPSRQ